MLVATTWRLGSHYDLSPLVRVWDPFAGGVREFEPGSPAQFLGLGLLPQLVAWTSYTIVSGMLGASLAWLLVRGKRPPLPQARGVLSVSGGSRVA
jgi:hypothetical protein